MDWEGVEDFVDGFFEAHIDHAVCFVHDNVAALGEDEEAALETVDETAGGCDDDFGAVAEVVGLFFDGVAADDGDAGEAEGGGELFGFRLDLLGEFAGRGEDDGVGSVVLCEFVERGELGDVDEEREDEGRGLPGAGDGDTDEVAVLERDGDCGALDGGGVFVPDVFDDFEETFGEV